MKVVIAIQTETPTGRETAARLSVDLQFMSQYAEVDRSQREAIEAKAADAIASWLDQWRATHRSVKRGQEIKVASVTMRMPAQRVVKRSENYSKNYSQKAA